MHQKKVLIVGETPNLAARCAVSRKAVSKLQRQLYLLERYRDRLVAERALRKALECAKSQKSLSLELGATTLLARLLSGNDEQDEAKKSLERLLRTVQPGVRVSGPARVESATRRTGTMKCGQRFPSTCHFGRKALRNEVRTLNNIAIFPSGNGYASIMFRLLAAGFDRCLRGGSRLSRAQVADDFAQCSINRPRDPRLLAH